MLNQSLTPRTLADKGGRQELLNFSFNGRPVRVVMRDGEPWWIASEVCRVLELSNPSSSLAGLHADERSYIHTVEGKRGNPKKIIISEPGLYALILRSRRPEAVEFKRWITHEVLPSIRRTGVYQLAKVEHRVPQTLQDALRAYANALDAAETLALECKQQQDIIQDQDGLISKQGHTIRELNDRNAAQAETIQELEPMAEGFERITETMPGSVIPTEAAKLLKVAPRKFTGFLRSIKWTYHNGCGRNVAFQSALDRGYLEHRMIQVSPLESVPQVMITPKGFNRLAQMVSRGEVA